MPDCDASSSSSCSSSSFSCCFLSCSSASISHFDFLLFPTIFDRLLPDCCWSVVADVDVVMFGGDTLVAVTGVVGVLFHSCVAVLHDTPSTWHTLLCC